MSHEDYTAREIGERGRAIYEERLKALLEPKHTGEYVLIDIDTGEYEVDEDRFTASHRAHAHSPKGVFFGMIVGSRSSGTLGISLSSRIGQ